jgi:Icc protein
MLIAQISDLHIRSNGELYGGVARSNAHLRLVVDHLHSLDTRPELVVVSGDLVDEGSPDEYVEVAAELERLTIPFLIMAGNHDDRDNLRRAFPLHCYLPQDGALNYCIDDHDLRIIALDTCGPGRHHGEIDGSTLSWLEFTLLANREKPTLVMMHHPPFACGIPYLDHFNLRAPGQLEDLLRRFDNIEAVVCGHVHRMMLKRWAGTVVIACPSTTTEIALQLQMTAQPQSYLGPSAYLIHRWEKGQGLVTHLAHVDHAAGPFPFF